MLFKIHDQPLTSKVGDRLADLLTVATNGDFSSVTLLAAFVKRAGVKRLEPSLQAAKQAGVTITSVVGIDHRVTTREGLSDLYSISDELFIVHSTRLDVTFHSKAYLFRGPTRATLIIGSSNITSGGMFTNIETCVEVEFTLPADAEELRKAYAGSSILKMLHRLMFARSIRTTCNHCFHCCLQRQAGTLSEGAPPEDNPAYQELLSFSEAGASQLRPHFRPERPRRRLPQVA